MEHKCRSRNIVAAVGTCVVHETLSLQGIHMSFSKHCRACMCTYRSRNNFACTSFIHVDIAIDILFYRLHSICNCMHMSIAMCHCTYHICKNIFNETVVSSILHECIHNEYLHSLYRCEHIPFSRYSWYSRELNCKQFSYVASAVHRRAVEPYGWDGAESDIQNP